MSRIYFHSKHGTVEVLGSERHHMAHTIDPTGSIFFSDDTAFGRALNRALKGNDTARFIARIHGQCEEHCYVEGPNRTWLAGIIERGRKTILRDGAGWESVIELLRSRDDGPVVTSFSVCESFPSFGLVAKYGTWTPTIASLEPSDEWYDLRFEEQWRTSMEALRKDNERGWLEMDPESWEEFKFRESN